MRRLYKSVMRVDTDPDVFIPEVHQPRDELHDSDEVVYVERLTTIVLDVSPVEKYSIMKIQVNRCPDLSLNEI